MDFDPLCYCGAPPAEGWADRMPGWPLCGEHQEPEAARVDVFVYGTLKSAYGNFSVVSDLCTEVRAGTVSGFGLVDLGAFPGAVADADGKVRGEVLTLASPTLALRRLDRLEGVPTLYTREEVSVALDDGTEVPAFMYVLANGDRRWVQGEVAKDANGAHDWHPRRSPRYDW